MREKERKKRCSDEGLMRETGAFVPLQPRERERSEREREGGGCGEGAVSAAASTAKEKIQQGREKKK